MHNRFALSTALALVIFLPVPLSTPTYPPPIDLGSLGPEFSSANGINNHGDVVGHSRDADGNEHAFLWSRGVMTDLGTLPEGFVSEAYDINSRGVVVGRSETMTEEFGPTEHAFLWADGAMIDLGTFGGPSSIAHAVNDTGYVVGSSQYYDGPSRAFLWRNGEMHDLGALGEGFGSQALGIAENGTVVGACEVELGGPSHACMWQGSGPVDLGTLGGSWSSAFGVNDRGMVVGVSETASGEFHAFLWASGQLTDITSPSASRSWATAISDTGNVVGFVGGPAGAFIWQNGTMTLLPSLGAFCNAYAINNRGQVAGDCDFPEASYVHATLWEVP